MLTLFREIFSVYSDYSGSGVVLMFYFSGLIFLALAVQTEGAHRRTVQTMFLYGSVWLTLVIFFVPLYYLYTRYVDAGTYWRLFWMLPISTGLAYVGTRLVDGHKVSGLLLALALLLLGGESVYSGESNGMRAVATNPYQLPQEVVDIVDEMEKSRVGETIRAAFPSEMLTYVRQYDARILMPYGREMLDPRWHEGESGYYEVMNAPTVDFAALALKCLYNDTQFIVVHGGKAQEADPRECGFRLYYMHDPYLVYEYVGE